MKRLLLATIFMAIVMSVTLAQADLMELTFTMEDFSAAIAPTPLPPPTDPVTGRIVYETDPITAYIDSLILIDLTIDGHTYQLSEVGFISPHTTSDHLIGGIVDGVNMCSSGKNDFWIGWNQDSLELISFVYTSSLYPYNAWGIDLDKDNYDLSLRELSAIPEPATLLFLGLGLISLVGVRKAIKK